MNRSRSVLLFAVLAIKAPVTDTQVGRYVCCSELQGGKPTDYEQTIAPFKQELEAHLAALQACANQTLQALAQEPAAAEPSGLTVKELFNVAIETLEALAACFKTAYYGKSQVHALQFAVSEIAMLNASEIRELRNFFVARLGYQCALERYDVLCAQYQHARVHKADIKEHFEDWVLKTVIEPELAIKTGCAVDALRPQEGWVTVTPEVRKAHLAISRMLFQVPLFLKDLITIEPLQKSSSECIAAEEGPQGLRADEGLAEAAEPTGATREPLPTQASPGLAEFAQLDRLGFEEDAGEDLEDDDRATTPASQISAPALALPTALARACGVLVPEAESAHEAEENAQTEGEEHDPWIEDAGAEATWSEPAADLLDYVATNLPYNVGVFWAIKPASWHTEDDSQIMTDLAYITRDDICLEKLIRDSVAPASVRMDVVVHPQRRQEICALAS